MEIVLIRHTSVVVDDNICYGQSELELTDDFYKEAQRVKGHLPDHKDLAFMSSPSTRCVKLANYLSQGQVETDIRLLEFNFGLWELKNWDDIPTNELNNWMNDYNYTRCPEGESYEEFFQRCQHFFEELITKNRSIVVIVTHGGVIRALISHVLKIPLENSFSLQIDLGSLSQLTIEQQMARVNFINRI